MKTQIIEMLDRKIEQSRKGIMINPLQELKQEILDTPGLENKWIDVTDEIVQSSGEVLAIGYQGEMLVGYLGFGDRSKYICESDGEYLSEVTHYMPLPNPPDIQS